MAGPSSSFLTLPSSSNCKGSQALDLWTELQPQPQSRAAEAGHVALIVGVLVNAFALSLPETCRGCGDTDTPPTAGRQAVFQVDEERSAVTALLCPDVPHVPWPTSNQFQRTCRCAFLDECTSAYFPDLTLT